MTAMGRYDAGPGDANLKPEPERRDSSDLPRRRLLRGCLAAPRAPLFSLRSGTTILTEHRAGNSRICTTTGQACETASHGDGVEVELARRDADGARVGLRVALGVGDQERQVGDTVEPAGES